MLLFRLVGLCGATANRCYRDSRSKPSRSSCMANRLPISSPGSREIADLLSPWVLSAYRPEIG